jgi:hypothetical protein
MYYNGAKPSNKETKSTESALYNPDIQLSEEGDNVYLTFSFDQAYYDNKGDMITTDFLGKAKVPKAPFDNPDGSFLKIDHDYSGNLRSDANNNAGPFINVDKGKVKLKVW